MKKSLITLAIVLLAVAGRAQIKVHDDNWVSIGCLNGSFGLQVTPSGYTYSRTQISDSYSWATLSIANHFGQKHWIVENHYNSDSACYKKHMFYVYGNGSVFSTGQYSIPPISAKCLYDNNSESLIDDEEALATILGINGYTYQEVPIASPEEIENNEYVDEAAVEGMKSDFEKRKVSLSAENLAEVFPDAVRTDSQARLCIDYNAVVTLLTQAMKKQQAEIEILRKTLVDNGLLESEKP